jgi:hypothetical protein
MKILKTLIQRVDDGELLAADTIEYEGKLWIVPEWLAGPTKGTEMPARIICLDNLLTAKPGPRFGLIWYYPFLCQKISLRAAH